MQSGVTGGRTAFGGGDGVAVHQLPGRSAAPAACLRHPPLVHFSSRCSLTWPAAACVCALLALQPQLAALAPPAGPCRCLHLQHIAPSQDARIKLHLRACTSTQWAQGAQAANTCCQKHCLLSAPSGWTAGILTVVSSSSGTSAMPSTRTAVAFPAVALEAMVLFSLLGCLRPHGFTIQQPLSNRQGGDHHLLAKKQMHLSLLSQPSRESNLLSQRDV
jgi:hypothetical protein